MLGEWNKRIVIVEAKYLMKWNPVLAKQWFAEVYPYASIDPFLAQEYNASAKFANDYLKYREQKKFKDNFFEQFEEGYRVPYADCEMALEDYLALKQMRG